MRREYDALREVLREISSTLKNMYREMKRANDYRGAELSIQHKPLTWGEIGSCGICGEPYIYIYKSHDDWRIDEDLGDLVCPSCWSADVNANEDIPE